MPYAVWRVSCSILQVSLTITTSSPLMMENWWILQLSELRDRWMGWSHRLRSWIPSFPISQASMNKGRPPRRPVSNPRNTHVMPNCDPSNPWGVFTNHQVVGAKCERTTWNPDILKKGQPIWKICDPSNWIICPRIGVKIPKKNWSCHHLVMYITPWKFNSLTV